MSVENNMNSQYLKIGDYVLLFTEQGGGFMTSIGFNHPGVFVQKCNEKELKMMPNMRNMVFKVVPKLVYDATREYQKEKTSLTSLKSQKSIRPKEEKEDDEQAQEKEQLARNLQILRVRMTQEQEFNQRLVTVRQGEVVLYGNEIQLQHFDSNAFLHIAKGNAEFDKECTQLELVTNPAPTRVVFEIFPRYKYRQVGDKVCYGDHILFYNTFTHSYIHFSNDQTLPMEENCDMPSNYRPQCPYRRPNIEQIFERYEVNLSSLYKKWQVYPYRQGQNEKEAGKFIHSGGVIRLKHAESGGYICIDEEPRAKQGEPNAYLRIYTGPDQLEQLSTNSLFEMELDGDKELGQPAQWNNPNNDKEKCKYRFRHLNSGRVLQLKTIQKNGKDIHTLTLDKLYHSTIPSLNENGDELVIKQEDQLELLRRELTKQKSMFVLESYTIDNDNFINGDSVVKIKSDNGLYLTSVKKKSENEEFDPNESVDSAAEDVEHLEVDVEDFLERNSLESDFNELMGETKIDTKIFTPMNKDEFNYQKTQHLLMRAKYKEDDIFILRKAEEQEVYDVLFIHSCVPTLKNFVYNIRKNQLDKFNVSYMAHLEKILSNLIFFVTETENKDPFTCEGIPNQKRQKYLREIRIIDLLVDFLHYPFSEKRYNILELTQRTPVTRICQLVYRLLKHCVKDYNLNKFYVAQYIELFINQAMTATESNNFKAESTLTELLKNNKVLLDKQITKETIQNFIDLCKFQKKNERFLNLLATLCSCNGDAVASNQDDVCEILLEYEENREALVLKMVSKGGSHEIFLKEPDVDNKVMWIRVEDLYEVSSKRDDLRIFNYFKSLINLNAEICLQRNYKGILLLEKLYSLDQVYHCAISATVPLKLRSKFAKLLLHLHIDKDPLEEITVPVLTRVWHEVASTNTSLPKSKVPIPQQLLQLKPFISRFLSELNGIQKAYEVDHNAYVLEILGLTQAMLSLGFYQDEDELITMIDPLITLLDGSLDIVSIEQEQLLQRKRTNQLEATVSGLAHSVSGSMQAKNDQERLKRYKTNESNLLLMMTKNKIISILHKVLDLQNDIRLTQFLSEYHREDTAACTTDEVRLIKKLIKGKSMDDILAKDPELESVKDAYNTNVINWMNKAFEDKNLDLERISVRDFVCILLDLILYENSDLINNAFKLLVRFFQQKQAIVELATEVQLLEDEQEIAILRCVSTQLTSMKKEAENAEFWFGLTNKDCLLKARNMMERFDMLTDLCIKKDVRIYDFTNPQNLNKSIMKNEINKASARRKSINAGQPSSRNGKRVEDDSELNANDVSEMLGEWDDDDIRVVPELEDNDPQNQRLLRNLRAYEVAMIIIRQQALAQAENKCSYLKVLEKTYIFLIKFVRNNSENQLLLMEYIDYFLEDLEYGVHALELIAEILKDNERIKTYSLAPIIKKICAIADEQSIESPKKATMISFLAYFMKCNGTPIKENQNLILNELTNSNRKNTLYLFTGEEGLETLELYMEEMKKHYGQFMLDEKLMPEIFVPAELSYTIEFIKLLSICCEGRNSMTELKCQSFLSIKDILDNLKQVQFCYPMKKVLADFLLHIYLDTEKDISEDNFSNLWLVFELLYEDLQKFAEIKKKALSNKKTIDDEKRGVPQNKSIGEKQIEKLMTVDVSKNFKMHSCFGSTPIIGYLEQYVYDSMVPVIDSFFEMRLKIDGPHIVLVKDTIKLLSKISAFASEKQYIKNMNNLFKCLYKIPQLKELSDGVKNQSVTQSAGNKVKGAASGLLEPPSPMKKNKGEDFKNVTKAMKLKAMMKSASESDEVRVEFEREFEQLILSIVFIKKKSEIGFEGKNTLETKDILKSLISLTDVNSDIDKDLRRTSLKILRKTIEMENKELTTPASEWDTDEWIKFEYQISQRQNMLTELGVIKLICRVIAYENLRSIKEEAFLCAISVLLGGNYTSQQKFFKYIQKDSENAFVTKVREMISECFEMIKKTEMKRNQLTLKYYQIEKKIEELRDLLDADGNEIKKMEQQLLIIEEELKDFDIKDIAKDQEALTSKRALGQLQIILRFLQLLCENHNLNLQDQLREQINMDGNVNGKSFDFVSQCAKMFGQMQRIFSSKTCDLGYQIVDCLIEFIQGPCHNNQRALITAKIIDSSRDFIAGFDKESEYSPIGFRAGIEEDLEKISVFKKKIATLLLSLLEGETDMDIVSRMAHSLDFAVFKERMLIVFSNFAKKLMKDDNLDISKLALSTLNGKLQKDSFEGSINEAFELYILMQTLAENMEIAEDQLQRKNFTAEQWKAYDFIRNHTGKIEIQVHSNLQSVYFPIRPVCHYISEQSKKKLMLNVSRESQASKVGGLMAKCPDLIDEMIHNEALSRSKIQITPQRLQALKDFSTLLACLANLILIIFLERVDHYRQTYYPDYAQNMIYYIGLCQGISSGLLIFAYMINRGGLITKAKWREYVKLNKTIYKPFDNEERLDITEMSIEMTHLILMTKGPEAPEFNIGKESKFGNVFTRFEYYMFNFWFFIQDGTFLYYVLYFMISMLGLFYLDVFYAFHLLDFISRSPVLQNVVRSVTMNGKQLLMTALLQVTIIFIYSCIGFFYLQDTFVDFNINKFEAESPEENFCNTMLQCFIQTMNLGLRNGGGIGDSTLPIAYEKKEKYFIKFVFDCTYHILIIIVMINILFGIIIDTFAQLRDNKKEIDEDMKNICFICNLDRYTFDKYSDGFERHIARDHNLWLYVFYIVHIQMKDQTEFTGIESYVSEKYAARDISWVPLMKALCLKNSKYQEENEGEE